MVISCPKCQRNYQIDTTRIPVGGTTFTCWTCRASVPVMREGMEEVLSTLPPPAEGGVPTGAIRFFESLADDAKIRRTTSQLPKLEEGPSEEPSISIVEPPPAPAPPAAIWPPRIDTSREEPAPTIPAASAAASQTMVQGSPFAAQPAPESGPTITTGSLDFSASDGILDLPAFDAAPTTGNLRGNDVLEIDEPLNPVVVDDPSHEPVAEAADASDVVLSYNVDDEAAGSESQPSPADEMRTMAMASPAAPKPAGDTLAMASPFALSGSSEGDEPESRAATAPPTPPPFPEPNRIELPRPVNRQRPPRPVIPPPTGDSPNTVPALAAVASTAVPNAADKSTREPDPLFAPTSSPPVDAAWVSPDVDAPSSKRSWLLPALAALVVIGAAIGLVWWLVLPQVSTNPANPAPASTKTDQPKPGPAPAESGKAPNEASKAPESAKGPSSEPTSKAPEEPTKAPPVETPSSTPQTGSGGYTIQVASNNNRAASDAVASTLKGQGFDAYVVEATIPGKGTWYRVRVGRFGSSGEAKSTLGKLRSAGLGSGAIVTAYGG